MRTEARLLVDAFLNRGKLKFQDLERPIVVGRSIESSVSSGLIPFRDKSVPGSHLVCEVRVMTRVGEGVVGVQLVMKAGGTRTEELPTRGATVGESRSTRAHSFNVDAPVERLCCLECEYGDEVMERLRVVTSGGRVSQWFGERLTANPTLVMLPDWRRDSLPATTAAVAAAARASLPSRESPVDGDGSSSGARAAAVAAAAEAEASAVAAPDRDRQKEYVTGLTGTRTRDRLVGLGVITRHVTSSHVFSYLWEAPEGEERVCPTSSVETSSEDNATSGQRSNATQLANMNAHRKPCCQSSPRDPRRSGLGTLTYQPMPSSASGSPAALGTTDFSPSSSGRAEAAGDDGLGSSGTGARASSEAGTGSTSALVFSRAEAKQQKFAKQMREREKKEEERERVIKEREENLERLVQGGKPSGKSEEPCPTDTAVGKAPPTPQEEFASVLRMRRTDARQALERSMALARAARKHRGRFGSDDHASALNSLPVVMGMATWLYAALLPRLVPLPVPATSSLTLFHRGETVLMAARATKARAGSFSRHVQNLLEERRSRPRQGVMSPAQRAQETKEREVGVNVINEQ